MIFSLEFVSTHISQIKAIMSRHDHPLEWSFSPVVKMVDLNGNQLLEGKNALFNCRSVISRTKWNVSGCILDGEYHSVTLRLSLPDGELLEEIPIKVMNTDVHMKSQSILKQHKLLEVEHKWIFEGVKFKVSKECLSEIKLLMETSQ